MGAVLGEFGGDIAPVHRGAVDGLAGATQFEGCHFDAARALNLTGVVVAGAHGHFGVAAYVGDEGGADVPLEGACLHGFLGGDYSRLEGCGCGMGGCGGGNQHEAGEGECACTPEEGGGQGGVCHESNIRCQKLIRADLL